MIGASRSRKVAPCFGLFYKDKTGKCVFLFDLQGKLGGLCRYRLVEADQFPGVVFGLVGDLHDAAKINVEITALVNG